MKNTLRNKRRSCRKTLSCKSTKEKVTLKQLKKEEMTPHNNPQVISDNSNKGV